MLCAAPATAPVGTLEPPPAPGGLQTPPPPSTQPPPPGAGLAAAPVESAFTPAPLTAPQAGPAPVPAAAPLPAAAPVPVSAPITAPVVAPVPAPLISTPVASAPALVGGISGLALAPASSPTSGAEQDFHAFDRGGAQLRSGRRTGAALPVKTVAE